jgi:hypothetical protein
LKIHRTIGGLVVMLLWCCACSQNESTKGLPRGSLTTVTDSQALPDKVQRLAFLARYVAPRSPIGDAEFMIKYQDNSGGAVPGPSDWDIRAVVQIEREGAAAWHQGWAACGGEGAPDTSWAAPLLARRPQWLALRSSPACYRNPRAPRSYIVVYVDEGIVLYKSASAPD